jgi:hypothetical protein
LPDASVTVPVSVARSAANDIAQPEKRSAAKTIIHFPMLFDI